MDQFLNREPARPQSPAADNLYLPRQARVEKIVQQNSLVRTFDLAFIDPILETDFSYQPGQFMMLSVPHCGEAPFSFSSAPTRGNGFSLSIRKVGRLTTALQEIRVGDTVAVRGPFGRPFPLEELAGRDLLFVAGGIGMAPLRSVIEFCIDRRGDFGDITVLYGCRTPEDICFQEDFRHWSGAGLLTALLTVDAPFPGWQGQVGLVTDLLVPAVVGRNTTALVCGPGIMIRFVVEKLRSLGLADGDILTTLERHMKCGVGICGHCHCDDKMICTDGPVFHVSELPDLEKL